MPETVMEDFVFGGIEADDGQLLANLRRQAKGLRHRNAITPRDPRPGEAVQLAVYVGPDLVVDQITAYVTIDGSEPQGHRGVAHNGFAVPLVLTASEWEAAIWDYVACWQGEIPGQLHDTVVQYRIEGWRSGDETFAAWSNEPHIDGVAELATRYGYHVDNFVTPAWAQAAVVYQIFVDRFAYRSDSTRDSARDNHGSSVRALVDRSGTKPIHRWRVGTDYRQTGLYCRVGGHGDLAQPDLCYPDLPRLRH